MLSRLKRRSASTSVHDLNAPDDDELCASAADTSSPKSSLKGTPKSNSSRTSNSNASRRQVSPTRERARTSRSSSISSFNDGKALSVQTDMHSRFLVVGNSERDGDIGHGSLSLDHLGNESAMFVVQAPELLAIRDSLPRSESLDSTDLRTPVIASQPTYFENATAASGPAVVTRSRSNTSTSHVPQPSGLEALAHANFNVEQTQLDPEGGPRGLSVSPVHSRPPSRPPSRTASRSSSFTGQQPSDLSLPRQASQGTPGDKSSKKSRPVHNSLSSALAASGATLVAPTTPSHRMSPMVRSSSSHSAPRQSFDTESDARSLAGDAMLLPDHLGDLDVVSQLGTGYAVASSKRNADFHTIFKNIPDDDYLIEDYGCALQREILIQGRLYISEHHLSFNANIFGWVTTLTIPFAEVVTIEKRMTAYVIPNAIQVTTLHARYTFASFLSRDTTYDLIGSIWRMIHPVVPASAALPDTAVRDADEDGESASIDSHEEAEQSTKRTRRRLRGLRKRGDTIDSGGAPANGGVSRKSRPDNVSPSAALRERDDIRLHPPTIDTCPALKNLKEVCMDTVFPSAPEKIYNLMFTSGFMEEFWTENQKLRDIQISDWAPQPTGGNLLARTMSYIKPLNAPIGPKQTKCLITDENVHVDFDDFVCVATTTRTPEVPSGNAFAVKTRTSMTWARNNSCRVVVTTGVEWTKSSFIKGIVERSCIEGQKTYHIDLEKAMRAYIHQHRSEFLEEGQEAEQSVADANDYASDAGAEAADDPAAKAHDHSQFERSSAVVVLLDGVAALGGALTGGFSTNSSLVVVIVILLLSNLWTFGNRPKADIVSLHSVSPGTADRTPDQVASALRDVLREHFGDKPTTSTSSSVPVAPEDHGAHGIRAALDELEARIARMRAALEAQ